MTASHIVRVGRGLDHFPRMNEWLGTEWEIDEELQSLGVARCDIKIARHEPATV